jgi:hypothetical protein
MTLTPGGDAELFMSTTGRPPQITGLLQGTGPRRETGLLPRVTDLHRGTGPLTLADLRAASLREPGHRDRHLGHRQDAADKEGTAHSRLASARPKTNNNHR